VDAWIAAAPPLEPRRLMPALMRLEDEQRSSQAVALRYVQFCIGRLASTDPTVHNLAVTDLGSLGLTLLKTLAGAARGLPRHVVGHAKAVTG
jgi:hypothetical protein